MPRAIYAPKNRLQNVFNCDHTTLFQHYMAIKPTQFNTGSSNLQIKEKKTETKERAYKALAGYLPSHLEQVSHK